MRMRASDLVVRALEDEGVRFAFGIPGTHNIELYDALERSDRVRPILVTDEQCASFMADAVSRSSDSIGVANVVPGAGVTHGLSGVAEALMDNVPMLLLTCGIRQDTGRAFQLHDIDQLALLRPITKGAFRPMTTEEVYPTLRRALRLARSGTPGPVAVEIPANLYMLSKDVAAPAFDEAPPPIPHPGEADLGEAVRLLDAARQVVLYVGNGARGAAAQVRDLAVLLGAPVATTIQGKGVMPESHPLWLWNGLGRSTPPFVRAVAGRADLLLAIGCRFGEVATASYGLEAPGNMIHVDINREVFQKNFPARLAIESDAAAFLDALLPRLRGRSRDEALERELALGHRAVRDEARADRSTGRVTPALFYEALQRAARPGAIYVTDSGNGTFLSMEHLRLEEPGCFLGPIDFSCMGYAVPAAVGAKLANPGRDVVALAGDGALLMTGLEMITASSLGVAPVVCVLRDRELGQIAQFQRTSLDRDTCSILPDYSVRDLAAFTRCEHADVPDDAALEREIPRAFETARGGRPVMLDVAIDYTRRTFFTRGVVATNFWRLPFGERLRMAGRLAGRKVAGLLGG